MISRKKIPFKINKALRDYLIDYGREKAMPIKYADLRRYESNIPIYDRNGVDTLWVNVFYNQGDMQEIYDSLKKLYAILKADGDLAVMHHLVIDRIDLCIYGNSQPFRVRIVNRINDNFDYFYIKNADASRVFGLELEHILSPNPVRYYVDGDTLIEEHIAGIPGETFIKTYLQSPNVNKVRMAKEFIKFNERCLYRLLGDMHSNNFVVEMIPDFEDFHYRIRAIDFDQQSYEGKLKVYLPQFFKQNITLVNLALENMTEESIEQYRKEERSMIVARIRSERHRIKDLGDAVLHAELSLPEHVGRIKDELNEYYKTTEFTTCRTMGEVVKTSLKMLIRRNMKHLRA